MHSIKPHIADIALPLPIDSLFTYIIPEELSSTARIGSRVLVPFGKKYLSGVIVDFPDESIIKSLKSIHDVLDAQPTISEELLKFCRWMSRYYIVPLGEVLRAAIPQGLSLESKRIVTLIVPKDSFDLSIVKKKSPRRAEVLRTLMILPRQKVAQLQKKTGIKNIHSILAELELQKIVKIDEELARPKAKPKIEKYLDIKQEVVEKLKLFIALPPARSQKQIKIAEMILHLSSQNQQSISLTDLMKKTSASSSVLKTFLKKLDIEIMSREVVRSTDEGIDEATLNLTLNVHQQLCLDELQKAFDKKIFKAFLLHGVTGSGKTQVYIEAIRAMRDSGKSAIVLVPEISLTPQTVRRFKAHFGDDVAVMHSQMSIGERYDAWRQARSGKCHIIVGPRSAIFAPLENIGLIIVDEEHESSYKQFDVSPRYNARDAAAVRAQKSDAVVLYGSATPSIESYHNALNGKYTLLELPERVDDARMPEIKIVDMVEERKIAHAAWRDDLKKKKAQNPGGGWIEASFEFKSISKILQEAIRERLTKKEGIILLQNRRGHSTILECLGCGAIEQCPHCSVTLTYHRMKKHLRCHYCGFVKHVSIECPVCRSAELSMRGLGTQKVEEELQSLFPAAKILRMDLDTTTRKGAHGRLLQKFGNGEADILLGTQMVAKGLDFPRVTLVGVISADTQMLLPDFRASERTFQLLTQVAGRAGRSTLPGEVLIQTYQSNHTALVHVLDHDFKKFYSEEIEHREELLYPPFSRIALIEIKGTDEKEIERHAHQLAGFIHQQHAPFQILGPAPAALAKIKNNYRWQIMIKIPKTVDQSGSLIRTVLSQVLNVYNEKSKSRNVHVTIDIDPQGMM